MSSLKVQLHNRKIFHHYLKHFSLEQLNTIPPGFNNNIIWNIAHTIVTQQLLMYKLSGHPMHIPDKWVDLYAKGTKPEQAVSKKEVSAIDEALFTTYEALERDLEQDLFNKSTAYTTSTNLLLENNSTTQTFILFHDGIHLGSVLALAKLV